MPTLDSPGTDSRATAIADFVKRWSASGAAERANYQLFLSELCDIVAVPRPDPTRADDRDNAYVFEKPVTFEGDATSSTGRIDLYKRGCFVLEAKQGSDATTEDGPGLFATVEAPARGRRGTAVRGTAGWDAAMIKARNQADRYVHALPASEGNPPFILVVDVGHIIEVYSDFSRLGKTYTPFPDSRSHRIKLADLADESVRTRLASIWTDPLSLDPSRRSAKVTREVAADLARLARSLEESGYQAELVSQFLMRLLFTLFAEDIKLITEDRFTAELKNCRGQLLNFPIIMRGIWIDMERGTQYSGYLRQKVLQFNGGLFEHAEALPLNEQQLELLITAAEKDWADVEPAIFGTLLERALDTRERHKLGAHFTPRAYVERLVLPTVIEPLREQWEAAKAAAFTLAFKGEIVAAREQLHAFLRELCKTKVLDPACGTGNFLYVAMEHMKRLEGEVRDELRQLGDSQEAIEGLGLTVDPHQFLGLEINPRARDIADVVLWIGYLKWHLKTLGHAPNPPILREYKNIKCQDAVLAYDKKELLLDESGKPVTRWDGRTMKQSPVTGEDVPDETARVPVYRYMNPHQASWPLTDYIVGNPPFVANRNMRAELGDGYVNALIAIYPEITQAVDLVMYFWLKGASLVSNGTVKRAGLITTSRFRMQQNQSVVRPLLQTECRFAFAIPDHPWEGESTEADVRVAMTVIQKADMAGILAPRLLIAPDHDSPARSRGEQSELQASELVEVVTRQIPADLSPSISIDTISDLEAWKGLCHAGMKPYAASLIVAEDRARTLFEDAVDFEKHAPRYLNGMDVARVPRGVRVLDFHGVQLAALQSRFPAAYQYLYDHTRPERAEERNPRLRRDWWLFEANREELRQAISGLTRYIVTVENSPNRYFVFVDASILPDQKLRVIADSDALILGILSTRFHKLFSTRLGGRHGVGNTPVYNTRCTVTFAVPPHSSASNAAIRTLGESLDTHRKRRQAAHPNLTITDMYNVLEKLRKNEELTAKDRVIHEQGLVSVLKQIHDELDAAVAEAYGWPADLADEEVLRRLVALNAERADEEKRGIIRWLRPEFQNPGGTAATQATLALPAAADQRAKTLPAKKPAWPKDLVTQIAAVRGVLAGASGPVTPAEVAKSYRGARVEKVAELLVALTALGQARKTEGERYAA